MSLASFPVRDAGAEIELGFSRRTGRELTFVVSGSPTTGPFVVQLRSASNGPRAKLSSEKNVSEYLVFKGDIRKCAWQGEHLLLGVESRGAKYQISFLSHRHFLATKRLLSTLSCLTEVASTAKNYQSKAKIPDLSHTQIYPPPCTSETRPARENRTIACQLWASYFNQQIYLDDQCRRDEITGDERVGFSCKDGGILVTCDFEKHGQRCGKVYHERCLGFKVPEDTYHWIW